MEVGTAMSLRQMKIVQKNVTASKEENSTSEVEFYGLEVVFFQLQAKFASLLPERREKPLSRAHARIPYAWFLLSLPSQKEIIP